MKLGFLEPHTGETGQDEENWNDASMARTMIPRESRDIVAYIPANLYWGITTERCESQVQQRRASVSQASVESFSTSPCRWCSLHIGQSS
jgi:hypothetical protein